MTTAKKKKYAASLIGQLRSLYADGVLTQRAMAEALHVNRITLNRWFRQGTAPTSDLTLASMAQLIKKHQ